MVIGSSRNVMLRSCCCGSAMSLILLEGGEPLWEPICFPRQPGAAFLAAARTVRAVHLREVPGG